MKRLRFLKDEIEAWPVGHKGCLECREVKEFACFTKNSQGRFGYLSICRECRKAESRKEYVDRSNEMALLRSAKNRSVLYNLPLNITVDDIIIPDTCPVLGIPLVRRSTRDNAPSLDRLIPEKGYVKGNINVVSMRANRLKSNATLHELELLTAWLREAL